jgi:AraC-like DNA-binding protein
MKPVAPVRKIFMMDAERSSVHHQRLGRTWRKVSSTPDALAVRHPLPGVWVVHFSGSRPLMRAVPEHYGSTMHLAGRSEWTSGGERWSSSPGSISLKVPGEVAVERAREGTPAFQVALFETSLIEEAQAALGRPRVQSWLHAIDRRDPRAKPLATLHRHLLDEAPSSASALEQATCEAVHALIDTMGTPSGATLVRCSPHVARARALLDERFTETIDLDALAAHAQLDKFRLCRAFREQVGMPPHAYVTHRRIARAQALLARGMPQAEVAASVGFYDQSLLHRHFKRILRITPGAFARAAAH